MTLTSEKKLPLLLWGLSLSVVVLLCLPLLYLLLRALSADADAWAILWRPRTGEILLNSLWLTLIVTTCATLLGFTLAWLTLRTDLPGRRVWLVLAVLPLALPSYLGAYTLLGAFGSQGVMQQLAEYAFGLRLVSPSGLWGAALVLTLYTYPFVLLSTWAALRGADRHQEEVARSLGRGTWVVFGRVILPRLLPAILAGAILVALYTLSDFGAVSLLRFDTLTRAVYLQYKAAFDRSAAAVLALVLAGVAALLMYLEHRIRRRYQLDGVPDRSVTRSPSQLPLGKWRWPALSLCVLLALLNLGLPLTVILHWLRLELQRGAGLDWGGELIANSLLSSALAAGSVVILALPVALFRQRIHSRLSPLVHYFSRLPQVLPGIVVALALVFFGSHYANFLYQSLALLVLAYVVRFFPLASGAISESLGRVNPQLEETGRSLGRSPLHMLRRVTLPLASPGMIAGAAMVFLAAMKELPATLLLAPNEFPTLATRIWTASENAYFGRAALPALYLLFFSGLSLWLIMGLSKKGNPS